MKIYYLLSVILTALVFPALATAQSHEGHGYRYPFKKPRVGCVAPECTKLTETKYVYDYKWVPYVIKQCENCQWNINRKVPEYDCPDPFCKRSCPDYNSCPCRDKTCPHWRIHWKKVLVKRKIVCECQGYECKIHQPKGCWELKPPKEVGINEKKKDKFKKVYVFKHATVMKDGTVILHGAHGSGPLPPAPGFIEIPHGNRGPLHHPQTMPLPHPYPVVPHGPVGEPMRNGTPPTYPHESIQHTNPVPNATGLAPAAGN